MPEPLISQGTVQRTSEDMPMIANNNSEVKPMVADNNNVDTLIAYYNTLSLNSGNDGGEPDDDYPRYQICINERIVGKPDKDDKSAFAHLSDAANWRIASISFLELARHIGNGYPFMPGLLNSTGRRRKDNVKGFNVLALDIDDGMSISEAVLTPFIRQYCGLGIESARSNTDGFGDRFRLVFALPRVVTVDEGIRLTLALLQKFPQADEACKNADRMFFGAPKRTPFLTQPNAVLPEDWIAETLAKGKPKSIVKRHQKPTEKTTEQATGNAKHDDKGLSDLWAQMSKLDLAERFDFALAWIAKTPEGKRRNTLNTVVYKTQYLWHKTPTIAERAFIAAGVECGLSEEESTKTVQEAMRDSLASLDEQPRLFQKYLYEFDQIMPHLRYNKRASALLNEEGKSVDTHLLWTQYSVASDLPPLGYGKFHEYLEGWARWGERPFDPVIEQLEKIEAQGLPSVEEAHDIMRALAVILNAKPQHIDRTQKILSVWFTGAVRRGFEPGCVFEYVLVLLGDGGCGKTSFFEQLALDSSLIYHAPMLFKWEPSTYQSMNAAHFCLFDEFDIYIKGQNSISEMKQMVTARRDKVRLPYARAPITLNRACVLGGTSNAEGLPDDGADNRRYLCVWLDWAHSGKERFAYYQQHKERIWAAALALYRSGFRSQLTELEEAEEHHARLEFKERSDAYVKVSQLLSKMKPGNRGDRLSNFALLLSDIQAAFGWRYHPNSREGKDIAQALKDNGWRRVMLRVDDNVVKAWARVDPAAVEGWATETDLRLLCL